MKSGGEAFRETVLGEKAKEGREDWFRALGTPAVVSRQKGEVSKHLKHSGRKVKGEPRSAMAEGKRKTVSEWLLGTWVESYRKNERLKHAQHLATWRPIS